LPDTSCRVHEPPVWQLIDHPEGGKVGDVKYSQKQTAQQIGASISINNKTFTVYLPLDGSLSSKVT
jgi:hypothetical protein